MEVQFIKPPRRIKITMDLNLSLLLKIADLPVSFIIGATTYLVGNRLGLAGGVNAMVAIGLAVLVCSVWNCKANKDCDTLAWAVNSSDLNNIPADVRDQLRDGDGAGGKYALISVMGIFKYGVSLYCHGDLVLANACTGPYPPWKEDVIMENMELIWDVLQRTASSRREKLVASLAVPM